VAKADRPTAIEMPGAKHYIFIGDEVFVLDEVRAFLKRLPPN
jgi:hypothetical protein